MVFTRFLSCILTYRSNFFEGEKQGLISVFEVSPLCLQLCLVDCNNLIQTSITAAEGKIECYH